MKFYATILAILMASSAQAAAAKVDCTKIVAHLNIDVRGDKSLKPVTSTSQCHIRTSNGFPIPDPSCTPGAVNPSLTLKTLRDASFRTKCIRDKNVSATAKDVAYAEYGITKPLNNRYANQICEKDHLVSLVIGGADSLDNIWPQCGPSHVELVNRYFKIKDGIEVYLGAQVRAGKMSLSEAQNGMAKDWTLYLHDAQDYWQTHKKPGGDGD